MISINIKIVVIVILLLLFSYISYSIVIPESFQSNDIKFYHKDTTTTTTTTTTSSTTSKILSLLSSYEIDSHIEIVLLGKVFNYNIANELSKSLEILSLTSRKFKPLKYVHEKIVYHVTVSTSLEKQLYNIIISNNIININSINQLLYDYHIRSSTTTTLFIFHYDNKVGNYSYESPLSYCSQRSFISSSGYAWLDLTTQASSILPTYNEDNILLIPDLSKLILTGKNSMLLVLSSLIHRSGEALIPFPLSSNDFIQLVSLPSHSLTSSNIISNSISSYYIANDINREVVIVLITICANDDVSLCDDDDVSYSTIEQLSQMYSSSSLKVGFTTIKMNLHTEPELSHAFHSSSRYSSSSSSSSSSKNVKIISSSELVYWLGSSSKMRESLSKLNGDDWGLKEKRSSSSSSSYIDKKILPVFSILLPETVEVYFEDYQKTMFVNFPEPPGGWGISKLDKSEDAQYAQDVASKLLWPSTAVLHLQHLYESSEKVSILQSKGLQCNGIGIPPTRKEVGHQLKIALREAIWGIQPPHIHYSSASHGIVHDYLWITPPSLYVEDANINDNTFREKRAVPRNILIKRCEYIISRFASVLQTAEAIYPPVNMTLLLGLGQSSQSITKKNDQNSKGAKQFKFDSVEIKYVSDNNSGNNGLLEDFLIALDEAATDISHLEYDVAQLRINNAETKLMNIEKEVNLILSARKGQIIYKDDDANELKNTTPSSFTKNILIFVSIIIGVSCAYVIKQL